jgi:hypothetical protein
VRAVHSHSIASAFGLTSAAGTLVLPFGSDNETARLRSATELLSATVKLGSDVGIAARLAELERQVAEQRVGE